MMSYAERLELHYNSYSTMKIDMGYLYYKRHSCGSLYRYEETESIPDELAGKQDVLGRRGKIVGTEWVRKYRVPKNVAALVRAVVDRHKALEGVEASSSAVAANQVREGLVELYKLAAQSSGDPVSLDDALRLGAELAALADLALEQEKVVRSVDSASLARTAAALQADIEGARQVLAKSDLEWKIDRAQAASK